MSSLRNFGLNPAGYWPSSRFPVTFDPHTPDAFLFRSRTTPTHSRLSTHCQFYFYVLCFSFCFRFIYVFTVVLVPVLRGFRCASFGLLKRLSLFWYVPSFCPPPKTKTSPPPDLFVFLIFECNISVFLCAPFFRAAYSGFLVNVCWQFVGCFGEPLNSYKFMSVNSRRKSIFNAFPFPFGGPPNVNSKLMRRQLCIRGNVYLEQFEFPLLLEWKTSRIRMEMKAECCFIF